MISAFSVLGGFAGAGFAWIIVVAAAGNSSRSRGNELVAGSIPLLQLGGALGFVAGFMFAWFLFKNRPARAQAEVEQKYIGNRGRWRIYAGFPMFFVALITMLGYQTLEDQVGVRSALYIGVLVLMVIVGISLYLADRIPRSLLIPVGLLGWMLLIGFGCWYFWFGPGSGGRH